MNKYKSRTCPVCQSMIEANTLYRQIFTLPKEHILPNWYNVISCKNCGFIYADTQACQKAYDKYYTEMSKYEMCYISDTSSLFKNRAARINTFIENKNISIIDVGCGNGQLLLELQKLGYTDLTALDPSKKCIEAIKKKGISGITSSVFDIPIYKKYDCIILSGVLEHIYDVPGIMQKMKFLAKENGLLFVMVPDASRYQNYDNIPFDYFNIEHINHFDESSLINLGLYNAWETIGLIKTTVTFYKEKQPIIFHVYKNSKKKAYNHKNYSTDKIKEYIKATDKKHNINMIIDNIAKSNEEIIIWGMGNYTSRLLATTNLNKCNISMFVDNDKNKHGMDISNRTVYPPCEILKKHKTSTIVIAVAVFYDEVLCEIKKMKLKNKVVILK